MTIPNGSSRATNQPIVFGCSWSMIPSTTFKWAYVQKGVNGNPSDFYVLPTKIMAGLALLLYMRE
jgi:hypothetical protein